MASGSLEESSTATSSSNIADQSWISWFCGMRDNHFFCRIDKAYIEDSFNLYGLKEDFNELLELILDRTEVDEGSSEQLHMAEMLYGLIHARYIISGQGLVAMHKKYLSKEFGECPRTCCNGQSALPVGISDEPGLTSVKIFCPKCRDIYNPMPGLKHIDGAYFGTAFPHMFLMTFENLVPYAPTHQYVSRIFGFKLHSTNACTPKVPPADASSLSLPSLERRDNYQHRFASRKSHNSDDNSSQLTFEEMQMLSRTPPDNNLNRKFATSNNITARNSSSNNHNHTTSQPISKSSSADKSLLTSTNEPYQDYITIRNEHMKDNTDNVGAAPHIDKKPRKN